MEMGILKESTAIGIRQLPLLYYCGNGQRNFGLGSLVDLNPVAQKRIINNNNNNNKAFI